MVFFQPDQLRDLAQRVSAKIGSSETQQLQGKRAASITENVLTESEPYKPQFSKFMRLNLDSSCKTQVPSSKKL